MNEKISMLDRYGENLTAKTYITDPAIARENEIKECMLILMTPEKSALLVGKAGIGKTAIVEGIAYRIQKGMVPNALLGWTIIKINITSLIGETQSEGQTENRIDLLVQELARSPKTILFIDETHLLVNRQGGLDFANMLKSGLDRGTIKMIGATTSDEYDYYIVKDKAFLRRLQKIEVCEPDKDATIKILMASLPKIEAQTNVKMNYTNFVKETIMTFIVDLTIEYNRVFESASRYPDICFVFLTKAFSYAIFDNTNVISIKHFWLALCNCDTVYPDVIKKYKPIFKEKFRDLIEKEKLLKLIELYNKEYNFVATIPISATQNENTNKIITEIEKNLPEGPAYYDVEEYTDQTERQLVEELIREKALRLLDQEVPHGIYVEVEKMKLRKTSKNQDIYDIEATIYVLRKSHKGIVIGKDGNMLKRIGTNARQDIEKMLDTKVNLKLWVKIKEGWQDNDSIVKKFKNE